MAVQLAVYLLEDGGVYLLEEPADPERAALLLEVSGRGRWETEPGSVENWVENETPEGNWTEIPTDFC